jgi:hypothetical protein
VFFFEKKNQKTFVPSDARGCNITSDRAKVFCFFFSKKKPLLPFISATPSPRHHRTRQSAVRSQTDQADTQ